jgi:DNA-binding NtrC family response regulator
MPARVVVVHDDPTFADPLAALLGAGQDVALFTDPMAALDALDTARTIEVLVTRVLFAPGQPNGIALARMARIKRPGIRVLFVALPEFARDAADLGTFMAYPVSVADVAETVGRLLAEC